MTKHRVIDLLGSSDLLFFLLYFFTPPHHTTPSSSPSRSATLPTLSPAAFVVNMTTAAENDIHNNTGAVPLIPLARRRNYSPLGSDLSNDDFHDAADSSYHGASNTAYNYNSHNNNSFNDGSNTASRGGRGGNMFATLKQPRKGSIKSVSIVSSYVFDWIIIIAILGAAYYLNGKAPNRRPFSLEDPNIS